MFAAWASIVWLVMLACIGLFYAYRLGSRSDYNVVETILYIPTYLMGRLLWRVHFLNEPPPALAAGAILAANHRSSVDPFFVQLAARRRVHWMVAKEYCQHFIFGAILKPFLVIPTNRSGVDTQAAKAALRLTGEGRLVGMFPEGQLNHTDDPLLPVRAGAALIAIKSRVPLIPLRIEGSPYDRTVLSPVVMPAHVAITFGTPIWPKNAIHHEGLSSDPEETFDDPDEMTRRWAQQIIALSDTPDFPARLARERTKRPSRQPTLQ